MAGWFLPARERRGLEVLYAYCRQVDDAVDEPGGGGKALLDRWRASFKGGKAAATPLMREMKWFCGTFNVPSSLLAELLDGAESDLRPKVRFQTYAALLKYCHQVAGVVGQACLPLFGVDPKQGREYAETLGRALQIINIIRDAGQDAALGRIYFAAEDLKAHAVSEQDWLAGRVGLALLNDYGQRAADLMSHARHLRQDLEGNLKAADLMADVYGDLLARMRADGCHVFTRRYRVPGWKKRWFVVRRMLGA